MRARRSTFGLAVTLLLFASACSSSSSSPSPDPADAGAGDAPSQTDGPDPLPPPPPFRIEEEAESPCTSTTSAQARALTTDGTLLTDLQIAGDRLVTRRFTGDGFVTFDANGGDPLEGNVGSDTKIAATPSRIVAAGVEDPSGMLLVRSFDARATALGAPQVLGPVRAGRAFALARGARSPESTIAVWVSPPSELRARVLTADNGAGAPIRLEDGAEFDDLTVVAAPSPSTTDDSEFLVVWALRRLALSSYRVYAALVSGDRIVGLPRIVFGSDVRITVAGLVTRAGGGATLLANQDGEPLVVPLDVLGRASAAGRLFRGARDPNVGGGQGIAFGHDRIAIVAAHGTDTHALRFLDTEGKPSGGWICLDAPIADAFHLGSIAATPAGWAALVATPTGTSLVALDPSGTAGR